MARSSIRLGNTGISSLTRSAGAAANTLTALHDSQAEYQFMNGSDRGQAAYDTYKSYLDGRLSQLTKSDTITGQSQAISMSKKVISATQAFNTSQIRSASTKVLEGTGTLQDKAATIRSLVDNASQNGDQATVDGLRQTYDTLQNTIASHNAADYKAQVEQQNKNAEVGVNTTKDYVDSLLHGNGVRVTGPNGEVIHSLQDLKDTIAAQGPQAFNGQGMNALFASAQQTLSEVANAYKHMIQESPTPAGKRTITDEYNKIVDGTTKFNLLPGSDNMLGDNGKGNSLSFSAIAQRSADLQNNVMVGRWVKDANGDWNISDPYTKGYRSSIGPDGQTHLIPVNGETNAYDAGKYSAAKKQLEADNFQVSEDQKTGQLKVIGRDGVERSFVLDQSGNFVSYDKQMNPDGTFKDNLVSLDVKGINGAQSSGMQNLQSGYETKPTSENGNAGKPVASFSSNDLKPELGTKVDSFINTNQQRNIIRQNLGKLKLAGGDMNDPLAKSAQQLLQLGDFGGGLQSGAFGGSLQSGNWAAQLQGSTQKAIELQNTARAAALQPAPTTGAYGTNLNQTPVSPNYQLRVAPSVPTPNIRVQPTQTQPTLSVGPTNGSSYGGTSLQGGNSSIQGTGASLQGSGSALQGSNFNLQVR
jgi:hypothetical protein